MKISPSSEKQLLPLLIEGLQSLQLSLSQHQQTQLLAYIALLCKWNRVYNLVATNDSRQILREHVLDSLAIAPYIRGQTILDVGSGAGFPGIPLAIVYPEKQFVLLDSIGKKVRFLHQAIQELQLSHVDAIQARAEAYQPEHPFDQIVSRAVSTINDMIPLIDHLLGENGQLLMMKGRYPEAELEQVLWRAEVIPLHVPHLVKERHLVVLERKHRD